MKFGLIFFSGYEAGAAGDVFRLVIEGARFADRHGFSAVWILDRHFTKDGHLFPNPSVIQAALARETRRIHLRAGSVVLPLHHPVRVAEEWAVVDNLSGGRVGILFASGWHPNDFALAPEQYVERHDAMYWGIRTVRQLWRGEPVPARSGDGGQIEVRTFPRPVQRELPVWITAAGNPKTFVAAGEMGAHVLTHLFNHGLDELAEKIGLYRDALQRHGHEAGQVILMDHTFIGADAADVSQTVRPAFSAYLRSASYLLDAIAYSRGQKIDLSRMSPADVEDYSRFVFDRFGTPETCSDLVMQLQAIGVNELACQLDFGVDVDAVLASLPNLNRLKERCNLDVDPGTKGFKTASVFPLTSQTTPPAGPSAERADRLNEVLGRCRNEIATADFYTRLRERGAEFEGAFQGIERLWRGEGEALGLVSLPDSLLEEAASYTVHPAFLDAWFQVLIAALPVDTPSGSRAGLYLPIGLSDFRVFGRPPRRVWSHARLRSDPGVPADICEGDVRVYDEAGALVAEALGLRLRRTGRVSLPAAAPDPYDDWLYELRWQPGTRRQGQPATASPGSWLIFNDRSGVGDALAAVLEDGGDTCYLVAPGDAFAREDGARFQVNPDRPGDVGQLIEAIREGDGDRSRWRGVVHLWNLDAPPPAEGPDPSFLDVAERLGCGSVLSLVQGLAQSEWPEPPRLWLVTRGAQAVPGEPTLVAVAQSPMWGFGRSLALEHPELWGGLVDLDPRDRAASDAARHLASEILAPDGEDQLAFRRGARFVARLVRSTVQKEPARPVRWRPDASYLITGGLGDLGLQVAGWMAAQGARQLILLGRTPVPPRDNWEMLEPDSPAGRRVRAVRELERSGVEVHAVAADVADPDRMRSVLEQARAEGWPPIRGVVHVAAAVRGGTLLTLDAGALGQVLRPKVAGGWVLDRLLDDATLDFFVLFSSISAQLGWLGQGAANYAAANAFLNALVQDRHARGRPALSINWGPWGEVGLAARTTGGLDRLALQGVGAIPPRQGLDVLERLMARCVPEVAVAILRWPEFFRVWPHAASAPLLAELAREAAGASANGSAAPEPGGAAGARIRAASPVERRSLIQAHLREIVAKVLGMGAARLETQQPLVNLGLDSLMAIELKNRIEVDLGVRVSMVELLRGPSVDQLIQHLLGQVADAQDSTLRRAVLATPAPVPLNGPAADTEWEVLTI